MKYDITLERMIQAHNYLVIFSGIMEKVFHLQIRGIGVQMLLQISV
jgi:hypothetical protein